jgi:hypothetical protein
MSIHQIEPASEWDRRYAACVAKKDTTEKIKQKRGPKVGSKDPRAAKVVEVVVRRSLGEIVMKLLGE